MSDYINREDAIKWLKNLSDEDVGLDEVVATRVKGGKNGRAEQDAGENT